MNILLSRFLVKNPLNSTKDVVKWWESKRLFYNFSNIISLFVGFIFVYVFNASLINFFLLPIVFLYLLYLNLFFYIGLIILILIKKTWLDFKIELSTSLMFIVFWVLSCFFTFVLCITLIIFNIS